MARPGRIAVAFCCMASNRCSLPVSPGYIGDFELVDDRRAGKIVVELNGRINKCAVISPRYDVAVSDMEKWTERLLPSRQVRQEYFRVVCLCTYCEVPCSCLCQFIFLGIPNGNSVPLLLLACTLESHCFVN